MEGNGRIDGYYWNGILKKIDMQIIETAEYRRMMESSKVKKEIVPKSMKWMDNRKLKIVQTNYVTVVLKRRQLAVHGSSNV